MSTVGFREPSIGLTIDFRSILTTINVIVCLSAICGFIYTIIDLQDSILTILYNYGFLGGHLPSVFLFVIVYSAVGAYGSHTLKLIHLQYYLTVTLISITTRLTVIVVGAIKSIKPDSLNLILLPTDLCLILLTLPVIAVSERSSISFPSSPRYGRRRFSI